MKKIYLLSILTVLFVSSQNADCQYTVSKQKTNIESWYLLLGMGYADISYPGVMQDAIDILKDAPGISHLPLNFNLGVYWPSSNNKNLYGVSVIGDLDDFDGSGEYMQIGTYLIGGSVIHHLSSTIGDAFYIRGDAGIAFGVFSSSGQPDSNSDIGFGLRGGLGYAIPVSMDTRILIDIGYIYRNIEDDAYGSLVFGAALLL